MIMNHRDKNVIKLKHHERIYYEYTDCTEFVYHTNYLKFMERARTEWLNSLGFSQRRLRQTHKVFFVVKSAKINYIKPARLDDYLVLNINKLQFKKASLNVFQEISLENQHKICEGEFLLACVSSVSFVPTKIPEIIIEVINNVS